jgi:hypothetical protein
MKHDAPSTNTIVATPEPVAVVDMRAGRALVLVQQGPRPAT